MEDDSSSKRLRVASTRLKESVESAVDYGLELESIETEPPLNYPTQPPGSPLGKRKAPAKLNEPVDQEAGGEVVRKKVGKRKASADGAAPGTEDALAELKAWIALHYPDNPLADPATCEEALFGWMVVEKPRPTGRHVDRYFITPTGKQLRSRPDVSRHLGLSAASSQKASKPSQKKAAASKAAASAPKPPPTAPSHTEAAPPPLLSAPSEDQGSEAVYDGLADDDHDGYDDDDQDDPEIHGEYYDSLMG